MGTTPRLHAVEDPSAGGAERAQQRLFYGAFLRYTTNRKGKPYAEKTITSYVDAVNSLDRYLVSTGFGRGFEFVDAAVLNAYFRHYFDANSQGGTNTRQRDLTVFFRWVAEEFDVPNPYDGKAVNRYSPAKTVIPVLTPEVITALLKVTADPKDYACARDHAIIRLFLSGMRLEQMVRLNVEHIDFAKQLAHIAGLKGALDHPVAFGGKTTLALSRWMRVRLSNKLAEAGCGPLWLGTKNRGRMTSSGIYQILNRRAEQVGLPKGSVHPHMFRHTKANDHLADGGSEGDLMQLMGWSDPTMVHRYGKALAQERALKDAHRRNLDDRY